MVAGRITVLDGVPTFFSRSAVGVVVKRFLPFDPNQPLLLPPDLREALPDGHPALLIGEIVDQLDLSEIHDRLEDGR